MRISTDRRNRKDIAVRLAPLTTTLLALACTPILPAPGANAADNYPSRSITMVVPFAAGGPTDIIARILVERMKVPLGQPIVVENVGGAGGSVGVGRVAHAPADGYTLSIGHWITHVVNGAVYKLQYDVRDFEPIALLPSNPYLILTRKDLPTPDLKALVAWLKANPDKASVSTAGLGSGPHLIGLNFQKVTGTSFAFVPYRGGSAPALQDQIAGHIDLRFDQAASSLPPIQAGQIKALAVTAKARTRLRARHPHRGRSRATRFLCFDLARALGTEGHAEDRCCHTECGGR